MTSEVLERDLLERTLGAAARDAQLVTAAGQSTGALPEGVIRSRVPTQVDDRASLVENTPLIPYSFGNTPGW